MTAIKQTILVLLLSLAMGACNSGDNSSIPEIPKPKPPTTDTTVDNKATLLSYSERLSYAKKNIATIRNGSAALNSLITSANKELSRTPESVADKNIVAKSRDVHDYISMGPYWWPDPSKPDGLPYIRKDGQRNPEVDKYDRYKLGRFINSINALSYAYFFTGDKKYATKAIDFLSVWFLDESTKMNPNLNFGQIIPGRDNNNGRAEGLIETYGFIEMLDCINLLIEANAIPSEKVEKIKKWYSDFLNWMLTSPIGLDEKSSKNNHGIAYDAQITAYALFAGREDIARTYINNFAADRLYKQIEADGRQPQELSRTLAMHYSLFNIQHMLDMCYLADRLKISLFTAASDDGRSIKKAIAFLVPYLGKSQSEFPYQQISDWEDNQDNLCWIMKISTFFEPNTTYDAAFDKYNTTKSTDFRWLYYAK